VIKYEDDGRIERNMLNTRHLDALKIDPQRKSHERNDDFPNH
jgi:hypothetical protein